MRGCALAFITSRTLPAPVPDAGAQDDAPGGMDGPTVVATTDLRMQMGALRDQVSVVDGYDQANGRLIEVTASGDVVWRYGGMETPGGFDVLANGGPLISDWALDRVFEIGPRRAP